MPSVLRAQQTLEAQVATLQRAVKRLQRRPMGGSFDPNENPVIIGSGATAGGGSTPSVLTGGASNAVAVGHGAQASGASGVAIGDSATASASFAIAIGDGAFADTGAGIAIGTSTSTDLSNIAIGTSTSAIALGTHGHAIAVGDGAHADYDYAVALGYLAAAGASNAVAIGHGAGSAFSSSVAIMGTADRANQILLGSNHIVEISNGFAMYDQNDGLRYEVSLNAGAFVFTQVS